jgi:hypothetical protein
VKERHVALRVKNIRFLAGLNEEALKTQTRLWQLLARSEGALLPEVTLQQKECIFDLVTQLLDHSLAECSRLSASAAAPPQRVLERCLGFAIALEHSKEIAMPTDTRTRALKLAALLDVDLLCQMIDGQFKRRLLNAGAKPRPGGGCPGGHGYGGSQARSNSTGANARGGLAWDEAVHAYCSRVTQGLQRLVSSTLSADIDDDGDGS